MNKKLENNIDNIHPDLLEVHQIELEDKPYMLRQRRKADDIHASKKLFDGIVEDQFKKAFPDDIKILDTYFKANDNSFFSGTYWSKLFMLEAIYEKSDWVDFNYTILLDEYDVDEEQVSNQPNLKLVDKEED